MSRETFTATFRGNAVRWFSSRQVFKTTSIYPERFAVLTYRRHGDSIDFDPSVVEVYGTVASCKKEIRDREVLRQWKGQSFIVRLLPGCTEIADAEIVEA